MSETGNVHHLQVVSIGDGAVVPADRILDSAKGILIECIVIGMDTDGEMHFASSHGGPQTLWLIEQAKAKLINMVARAT